MRNVFSNRDRQFREALRTRDIETWIALWAPYGECPECLQQAARPCLNMLPQAARLHLSQPHPSRPAHTPEST